MALAIRCVIVDMWLHPSMPIGVNSTTIEHESRNGSPAPLSSSAADTATSPRWRTTESNRGNRFTARPVRSPMLSTEPQSSPASTNSSGNSPGSRLKSKISRSGWSTLSLRAAFPISSLIGSPLGNGLNPLEKPEKPSRYSSRNQGPESSRKPRVSRRAVTLEDVTAMRGNPPVLSRRGVVVWT